MFSGEVSRLIALWSVITSQQPTVCPCINSMQAASLSATRTAITAAEVFEMQDKDPRTLRIAGELVLRLWVSAHITSAGKLRMCSGFQAGSKRCRVPRANAGDVRLAVASNPMAIGASFIIGLLAGGSIYSMADDFYARSRAGVVSADTRKTVPSGRSNE